MFALSNLVALCAFVAPAPTYTVYVRDLAAPEVATRYLASGSETVSDALELLAKPADAARLDMWIARPVKGGEPRILPIDWAGITQRGLTSTNYLFLPGDRLFVQARPAK